MLCYVQQCPARVALATRNAEAMLGVVEKQSMAKARAGSSSSRTGELAS